MTEARFSITRRSAAGDLVTVRGDTQLEIAGNFNFIWGQDQFGPYCDDLIADTPVGSGRAKAILGNSEPPAGLASAGLISVAAKKAGKRPSDLAGITTAEAQRLIKEGV